MNTHESLKCLLTFSIVVPHFKVRIQCYTLLFISIWTSWLNRIFNRLDYSRYLCYIIENLYLFPFLCILRCSTKNTTTILEITLLWKNRKVVGYAITWYWLIRWIQYLYILMYVILQFHNKLCMLIIRKTCTHPIL